MRTFSLLILVLFFTIYLVPFGSKVYAKTLNVPKDYPNIQEALNNVNAGDTILIAPGVYTGSYGLYGHAELRPNNENSKTGVFSGTKDAPIIIKAINPAVTTADSSLRSIIKGPAKTRDDYIKEVPKKAGLYLQGVSNIVIDGLEVTGWSSGIELQDGVTNVVVKNSILRSNVSTGIQCSYCINGTFTNNAFIDPGLPYPEQDDAIQDYGISTYNGSKNIKITHNYFFGKHNQALSFKRKTIGGYAAFNTFEGCQYTCIYIGQNDDDYSDENKQNPQDMTSADIIVEYNHITDAYDNGFGSYVGASKDTYYRVKTPITIRNVNNAVVRYNFIENVNRFSPSNFNAGISIASCESTYYCEVKLGREPVNAFIYGNTLAGVYKYSAVEAYGRGYKGDTIHFYNNTFYNTQGGLYLKSPSISNAGYMGRSDFVIKNNNFVDAQDDAGNPVFQVYAETPGNLTVSHNNFYNTKGSVEGAFATDPKIDFGVIFKFNPLFKGTYAPKKVYGPSIKLTPDFSNAYPLSLANNSPLLDKGANLPSNLSDYPVKGSAPDIGSAEVIEKYKELSDSNGNGGGSEGGGNGNQEPIKGDINEDGVLNIKDLISMVTSFVNTQTVPQDINMDGKKDVLDIVALVNLLF